MQLTGTTGKLWQQLGTMGNYRQPCATVNNNGQLTGTAGHLWQQCATEQQWATEATMHNISNEIHNL